MVYWQGTVRRIQRFLILVYIGAKSEKIFKNNYNKFTYKKKQPPEGFCKKSVFRSFEKFTGKHLCQSLFFNKVFIKQLYLVTGFCVVVTFAFNNSSYIPRRIRPATLLKMRLWQLICFPVDFTKFLRIPFLQNTSDSYFCFLYISSCNSSEAYSEPSQKSKIERFVKIVND